MQGWEHSNQVQTWQARDRFLSSASRLKTRQRYFTFGMYSTTPPSTDPPMVLQRADEVNTVRRMLANAQTSAVILTGEAGVGKSILAALVYQRLRSSAQAGIEAFPAPKHFAWLSINSFANLPDVIAAILLGINADTTGFFLLKPEQQISALLLALRRPQESALIVLDQFEELLDHETAQGLLGRGALPAFFEMLQTDLGASRLLLTSYQSPYGSMNADENRVRSYLVSRVSIPEGVALLQQRGLLGSYEELSLSWQRCAGHVFALLLFTALFHLSKFSLSYLLNSPDYQPLWSGNVTLHMIDALYRCLSPVQCILIRALCLFAEPVSLKGIILTISGESAPPGTALFERELGSLVQLSLVQQSADEEGTNGYALHALLRQYIAAHYLEGSDSRHNNVVSTALGVSSPLNSVLGDLDIDDPESREIALAAGHMQVAAYYQRVAEECCPPRQQRANLQDVAPLLHAIRHYCLGWHWQQACDVLFGEGLHESLMQWGPWNTLIGLYTSMLPPSGMLTRHDEGLINSHLGLLYARLGEFQQSQACYEYALAIQRTIGDQHEEAVTLVNLGELLRNKGAAREARACFEQALRLNRQQKQQDPLVESALLHNLGLLHHTEKEYQQAMAYYRESLNLASRLHERYNVAMIVTNMGMLRYEQGSQVEGIALLLFALEVRQSLQDPTATLVERFLSTLEQKMGAAAFARLHQAALSMQEQLLAQLFSSQRA